jgi:hypothetical protein
MGDELRFYDAKDYEQLWLPEEVTPQPRPRTMIPTPKVMVSAFWPPLSFPVITALPPRTKFTAACFCSHIILKIVEGMPFDLANSPRRLMLHMNNATPAPSPGINHAFKEIPNLSNLPTALLPGLGAL